MNNEYSFRYMSEYVFCDMYVHISKLSFKSCTDIIDCKFNTCSRLHGIWNTYVKTSLRY